MKKLIVLLALALALSADVMAKSLLMGFNIATYEIEDVCIDEVGWVAEFQESSVCYVDTMQNACGNMEAGPTCTGGQFFASSDNCDGQGALNKHLEFSCALVSVKALNETLLSAEEKYRIVVAHRFAAKRKALVKKLSR